MHLRAQQLLAKETNVRTKAKQLQKSLLLMREQKLNRFRSELKQTSLNAIQKKYEEFKVEFESFFVDQLDSLRTEKEMKLSQIQDIQDQIRRAMYEVQTNNKKILSIKQDLDEASSTAQEHLKLNQQSQLKEFRSAIKQEVRQKTSQYEGSIYLE